MFVPFCKLYLLLLNFQKPNPCFHKGTISFFAKENEQMGCPSHLLLRGTLKGRWLYSIAATPSRNKFQDLSWSSVTATCKRHDLDRFNAQIHDFLRQKHTKPTEHLRVCTRLTDTHLSIEIEALAHFSTKKIKKNVPERHQFQKVADTSSANVGTCSRPIFNNSNGILANPRGLKAEKDRSINMAQMISNARSPQRLLCSPHYMRRRRGTLNTKQFCKRLR